VVSLTPRKTNYDRLIKSELTHVKHRCKRLHKSFAGLGRRYAAGRARKKTRPQTLLKPPSV